MMYFVAKIGVDTVENGPFNVWQKLARKEKLAPR